MKRIFNLSVQTLYSIILCLCVVLIGCTKENVPITVTGVTLSPTSITLVEGESQSLTAVISPSNAENQQVRWSSSDASVATVANGKVTAIKAGNATITVTTEDGGKTATCAVKVTAKVYPVTGVSLDKTTCELTVGGDVTLTATINPANATNKNVTWKTSDATVATVVNGKVTALKAGTATITVTTEDGNKTATCTVTVKATISTEQDSGNLNYGSEGGAGDNISEKEIINGGSH